MKVGDYVRTKSGLIGKIIDINLGDFQTRYELDNSDEFHYEYKNDIIKSDPKLIKLVQVGDYVNGYKVEYVCDDGVYIEISFVDDQSIGCNVNLIRPNEIKSIVAKEQFESVQYEVK